MLRKLLALDEWGASEEIAERGMGVHARLRIRLALQEQQEDDESQPGCLVLLLLEACMDWTALMSLTPELSRTALRPWASENEQSSHEAAKRARLERIVRPVPAVAFEQLTHLT